MSLPCQNVYYNRKLLPISRCTPILKLALLLLAGDVSVNPGPAVKRNVRLVIKNVMFDPFVTRLLHSVVY